MERFSPTHSQDNSSPSSSQYFTPPSTSDPQTSADRQEATEILQRLLEAKLIQYS